MPTIQQASKSDEIFEQRSSLLPSERVHELTLELERNPNQPDIWMQRGIELKKQLLLREAIESYSMGLSYNPFHALLYRHRGHAYINIREYRQAVADLTLSVRIDPLNWDSWYHLGLGYFLMEEYARARAAYEQCLALTAEDDVESMSAVTDWYWMTLMHLGETDLAKQAAERLPLDANVVANRDYYTRVMIYRGLRDAEEVLEQAKDLNDHMYATMVYGISYYYELQGKKEEAYAILKEIERRDGTWCGFAESAAYERLKKWS